MRAGLYLFPSNARDKRLHVNIRGIVLECKTPTRQAQITLSDSVTRQHRNEHCKECPYRIEEHSVMQAYRSAEEYIRNKAKTSDEFLNACLNQADTTWLDRSRVSRENLVEFAALETNKIPLLRRYYKRHSDACPGQFEGRKIWGDSYMNTTPCRAGKSVSDELTIQLPELVWRQRITPNGDLFYLMTEQEEYLHPYKLGNVHDDGRICWGRVNPMDIREGQSYFFTSQFNSDLVPASSNSTYQHYQSYAGEIINEHYGRSVDNERVVYIPDSVAGVVLFRREGVPINVRIYHYEERRFSVDPAFEMENNAVALDYLHPTEVTVGYAYDCKDDCNEVVVYVPDLTVQKCAFNTKRTYKVNLEKVSRTFSHFKQTKDFQIYKKIDKTVSAMLKKIEPTDPNLTFRDIVKTIHKGCNKAVATFINNKRALPIADANYE